MIDEMVSRSIMRIAVIISTPERAASGMRPTGPAAKDTTPSSTSA